MKQMGWYLCMGMMALLFTQGEALAQVTALIAGTARDQTGAVLPGVEVTATHTDTGISRTVITNERGAYVLPNLPLGSHRLEASLPGFTTFVRSGIILVVNANVVIDPIMEVGQVAETVEVQANAALVETRSQGVGELVENQRILELPLNGRNVEQLITLAGGTQQGEPGFGDGGGNVFNDTGAFSVAGGLAQGLNFALDGADHANMSNNLQLPMPFPDALQEFKVETSALSAKHGSHSAGSVALVTKSGTNEYHGNAFEFVRNYKFNARNFFAPQRDSLKRNQFGGTIGGPILRNKLFFFGGYQGTYVRSDSANQREFVPTAAMLAGDFTAVTSAACRSAGALALPSTIPGNPAGRPADFVHFTENHIDPSLFSPAAVAYAKRLPAAVDECGSTFTGRINKEDDRQAVGRVDYQVNNKHSIFGRYMATKLNRPAAYDVTQNLLTLQYAGANALVQSFTFGDTYLFGANVVHSLRLYGNRLKQGRLAPTVDFSLSDIGVNIYDDYHPNYPIVRGGSFTAGTTSGTNLRTDGATLGLADDVSWVFGEHQLEFGFSGSNVYMNFISDAWAPGHMYFNGQWTGLAQADFLLGYTQRFVQGVPIRTSMRKWNMGLYGQDTWRLAPRVTMNYGVRWEPFFPPDFGLGSLNYSHDRFAQGVKSTAFKNAPAGVYYEGDPGFPGSSGVNKKWDNISPRLGLAWDVTGDGRTSVRASYGLFFDFYAGHFFIDLNQSPPWFPTIRAPGAYMDDPWANFPGGNPHPFVATSDVQFVPFSDYVVMNYDLKPPAVSQWNLAVQRQIGNDWLVSATYLGATSTHLQTRQALNPSVYIPGASTQRNTNQRRVLYLENPAEGQFYGNLNLTDTGGTGSYNGLVLSIERRSASGLNFNANYTWSHCISDPYRDTMDNGDGVYSNPFDRRYDRGNCNSSAVDRRHAFNLTMVAEAPQFQSSALRALAGGWRLSPILRVRSGSFFDVQAGEDAAFNSTGTQRADQLLSNVYGDKSVENYLNPAAFAVPATGTLTTSQGAGAIQGPGFWGLDVALSRSFQVRETQRIEFRAEAFNLTNSLRMGSPQNDLSRNDFGVVSSAEDPRIIQFAIKYVF